MLRLAHRILTQKPHYYHSPRRSEGETLAAMKKDIECIQQGEAVIADNVKIFLDQNQKTRYEIEDIPCPKAPFLGMWIEWMLDSTTIDEHGKAEAVRQFGAVVKSLDVGELIANRCPGYGDLPKEYDRLQIFSLWGEVAGDPVYFNAEIGLMLDAAGMIIKHFTPHAGPSNDIQKMTGMALPAWMALAFMNCKNVVHHDVTESEGPTQKWLRRQKAPKIRYRVLDINPMKEVLRTEGGVEANGLKKALHICRGHFCTYTAEKPLFGTYVGTVWKPAHVRGDIKQGAVVKDYRVNPD